MGLSYRSITPLLLLAHALSSNELRIITLLVCYIAFYFACTRTVLGWGIARYARGSLEDSRKCRLVNRDGSKEEWRGISLCSPLTGLEEAKES